MDEPNLGLRRIQKLKELASMYFELPHKAHIKKPDQLLLLFSIRASKKKKHPHKGHKVYISRRALKHFVERRKSELSKNHSRDEVLQYIFFALDKIKEILTNYDSYEPSGSRYIYTKDYTASDTHLLRVIVDKKDTTLEICSIHFKTKRSSWNKQ